MPTVRMVWLLIGLLWVFAEIQLLRNTAVAKQQVLDAETNSRKWLWISLIGAFSLALYFKNQAWLPMFIEYPLRQWLAMLLFAIGLGIRYWAITALGQFFTTHVLIQEQHQLITDGLYKWLRHPAYTGLLLALAAAGLAMGDGLACLSMTIIPLVALKYRIAVEEAKLIDAFGEQYLTYIQRSYCLLPWLY